MIYKFIDNNGAEITVNSLSSLQALVDSETIKENTKVKAGLRGKWVTALDVPDLKFEEEAIEEPPEEVNDIIDIITKEEKPPVKIPEEIKDVPEDKPKINNDNIKKEVIAKDDEKAETSTKESFDQAEEDRILALYEDIKMEDINFVQTVQICFKKFANFKDRASRSEYWWWALLTSVISIPSYLPYENFQVVAGLVWIVIFLPTIAVTVRRLHDLNKSGWFILISLIPILGTLILIFILIERGTLGKNRFGDYPLKFKSNK